MTSWFFEGMPYPDMDGWLTKAGERLPQCPLCTLGGSWINNAALNRHIAGSHGLQAIDHETFGMGSRDYECKVCGEMFGRREWAIDHVLSTEGHIKAILVQESLKRC